MRPSWRRKFKLGVATEQIQQHVRAILGALTEEAITVEGKKSMLIRRMKSKKLYEQANVLVFFVWDIRRQQEANISVCIVWFWKLTLLILAETQCCSFWTKSGSATFLKVFLVVLKCLISAGVRHKCCKSLKLKLVSVDVPWELFLSYGSPRENLETAHDLIILLSKNRFWNYRS